MADNKNMELDDEMMANASGGTDEAPGSNPRFNVGDRVTFELNYNDGTIMIIGTVKSYHWSSFSGQWEYDILAENDPFGHAEEKNIWEKHLSYAITV